MKELANRKPSTIEEYYCWLEEKHKIKITDKLRVHYETVSTRMRRDFEKSVFWTHFLENLEDFHFRYMKNTNYPLFIDFEPEIVIKSFDSFILKTFRKNILENKNWPNKPDGWILPANWYSKINDIIRTLIVVKYIDGVEFIVNEIRSICDLFELNNLVYFEAREVGYYAAHFYVKSQCEIPTTSWDTELIEGSFEIQVTTQLQEVIRQLLHKFYKEKRISKDREEIKWQWNYKSDEFVGNYLGHILHYVEGMIMEVREKQKDDKR